MALSRTVLLTDNSAAGHGTSGWTSGAFTPPDNSVVVAAVAFMEDSGTTDPTGDVSLSGGGLTWTKQQTAAAIGAWTGGVAIWTAPVATGTSMSVTVDCAARNIYRYVCSVVAYTGADTAVGGKAKLDTGPVNGAATMNLDAEPQNGSEIFAALMSDTGSGSAPGSGWTEIHDVQTLGDTGIQTQVRSATAGTFGVAQTVAAAHSASRSPTATFPAPPQAGDIVVLFPSATVTGITLTIPAGWVNVLGGTTDVESDAHQMCAVYHVVTETESDANTRTFTATDLAGADFTGNTIGIVLRAVDQTTPLDAAAAGSATTNATPHVIPALTGASLSDGSLVLGCVTKDTTGTYTAPAGWTVRATSNSNQGKWAGTRDTLTTAGTDVAATNITPSAGDEYVAVNSAWTSDAAPPNERTVTWADVATGTAPTMAAFAAVEIVEGSTEATGTLAETEDGQTSSAAGTVANPVTGTVSETQAAQTSSAAGEVVNPVVGTVTVAQAAQTSTVAGVETIAGTLVRAQTAQSSSAAGVETFTGALSEAQDGHTAAAGGAVANPVTGTLTGAQAAHTLAASGTAGPLEPTGTVAETQADQTLAAAGAETLSGALARAQAAQTTSAAGVETIAGPAATFQASQLVAAAGTVAVPVVGTAILSQTGDILAATAFAGALDTPPDRTATVRADQRSMTVARRTAAKIRSDQRTETIRDYR